METPVVTYQCTVVTRDRRSERTDCAVRLPSDASLVTIAAAAVRKVYGRQYGFHRDPGLLPTYGNVTTGRGGVTTLHDAVRVDVEMPPPAWRVVDRADSFRVRWEGADYEAAKAESDRLDDEGGETVVIERRGRTWAEERPEVVYG